MSLLMPVLIGAFVAVPTFTAVEAPKPDGRDYEALGREVTEQVREVFFDTRLAEKWAREHEGYAAGVVGRAEFARRTNEALSTLGASHTGYYTPLDVRHYELRAVFRQDAPEEVAGYTGVDADFARVAEGWFVRRVFPGGPAEAAGLRRGDEVLSADGHSFDPVLSFEGCWDRAVRLMVRRWKDEPAVPVLVAPRRRNLREAWLEWQKRGTRVIERGGRKVLHIPYFVGAGEEFAAAIGEALAEPGVEFDAVVLDCRDGLGGTSPDFVTLFSREIPVLEFGGPGREWSALRSEHWPGPLVLIVNGGTRSGKEIVADWVKRRGRGVIVGERTAGAVLGGQLFPLSDGSVLYLAVSDVRVDGKRLEGNGVEPDVPVADRLPYAAGEDPQLEAALRVAAEAVER